MNYSILSFVGGCFILSLLPQFTTLSCPRKYEGFPGHTACISKSSKYISGDVNLEDQKNILALHNKFRASVVPPACMMLKLYWDDELANIAQRWAENCIFEHDKGKLRMVPGSFSVGQNLAMGFSTWDGAIKAWQKEVENFNYNGTVDIHLVGHYTQMVTSKTGLIGCGYATCKTFKFHVCNYAPAGNGIPLSVPYAKCAKNPPLKDCKGKLCKNEGIFKINSCDCQCKKIRHIYGPVCDINCTEKDRNMPCEKFYTENDCTYTNVPYECPWLCDVCPFITGAAEQTTSTTSPQPTTETSTILSSRPTFVSDFSGVTRPTFPVKSILLMMALFLFVMI